MKSVLTRRSFIAGASGFAAALTSCGVFAAVALAAPGQPPQKPGEGGGPGGGPGGGLGGGPGGGDAGANTEPNATVILQDGDALSGGTYTATEVDQSVFEASGNVTATLDGVSIQKTAGNASSADGSSFYGVNAAVRVYGDAHVTLKNCKVTAQAENATGVFAYQTV